MIDEAKKDRGLPNVLDRFGPQPDNKKNSEPKKPVVAAAEAVPEIVKIIADVEPKQVANVINAVLSMLETDSQAEDENNIQPTVLKLNRLQTIRMERDYQEQKPKRRWWRWW